MFYYIVRCRDAKENKNDFTYLCKILIVEEWFNYINDFVRKSITKVFFRKKIHSVYKSRYLLQFITSSGNMSRETASIRVLT